jgi:hypothetical protein
MILYFSYFNFLCFGSNQENKGFRSLKEEELLQDYLDSKSMKDGEKYLMILTLK